MDLLNPVAEVYAQNFSSPLDSLQEEVARYTESSHPHAHMMSSRLQGKFLEIISILISPSKILEIGTFTGFSALCLAKGLKTGGNLHTIEVREEDADTARGYFQRSIFQSLL